MMKIFFHTRTDGKADWDNRPIELLDVARLPTVGEYICLENESADWHLVQMVVHVAFQADYMAEVYCVKVNHMEAHRRAGIIAP